MSSTFAPGLVNVDALKELMSQDVEQLKASSQRWFREKPQIHGQAIGVSTLDKLTGGLVPDEFIILAADPGGGKTSLMMQALETSAADLPKGSFNLIISAEMSKRGLLMRSACRRAEIDSGALRRGEVSAEQLERFTTALDTITALPLLIVDHPGITSDDMLSIARNLQADGVLFGTIAVDYVQQLYDEGEGVARLNHIVSNLVKVRKETGACVLALSQYSLAKSKEKREPEWWDLLGTGNLARAADQIWMLHEPENPAPPLRANNGSGPIIGYERQLFVRKNRNGRLGTLSLWFQPERTFWYCHEDYQAWLRARAARAQQHQAASGGAVILRHPAVS